MTDDVIGRQNWYLAGNFEQKWRDTLADLFHMESTFCSVNVAPKHVVIEL